jgi:nucleoid-associated protein YgaU
VGKLEKVVVLTVLFLVALILGVSLNAPEGVAKPDPTAIAADEAALDAEPAPQRSAPISRPPSDKGGTGGTGAAKKAVAPSALAPTTVAAGDPAARPLAPHGGLVQADLQRPAGPAGTLSTAPPAVVEAAAPAATAPPASSAAQDGKLQTMVGLSPSLSDEFMIYTWQEGDTFAGVAERYFGSRLHVNRLLRNNEGIEDRQLRAGDQILIPAHAAGEAAGTAVASGATTYEVQAGDVLGTISMNVYGTSKSWRKIYDANRDVLADPNRLVVGQVLRIPE